jgi:hypothetical protein
MVLLPINLRLCGNSAAHGAQAITNEISALQEKVKDQDLMKRQIDECVGYQTSVAAERELRARIEQVSLHSCHHFHQGS